MDEYLWVLDDFGPVDSYCLALIQGVAPSDVLTRIGAAPEARYESLDEIYEPAALAYPTGRYLVAATQLDDWTLTIESNGFLMSIDSVARRVRATTFVSHYFCVAGGDKFLWFDGDTLRLAFVPTQPSRRDGTEAESAAPLLTAVGFDLTEDIYEREEIQEVPACFALGERLTGIRLTANQLQYADYVGGYAQAPAN